MLSGRSVVFVRDFEALLPTLMAGIEEHSDEFSDLALAVYAANFSTQELREVTAFQPDRSCWNASPRSRDKVWRWDRLGAPKSAKTSSGAFDALSKKGYNI
jgi:hypothetical protein